MASSSWIDPSNSTSLAVLVESVIGPMLMQHPTPVCLELEIDPHLSVPANAAQTVELVRALTRQALDEMRQGGDLMVTACETAEGIEFEMADNGTDVETRSQRIPLVAASLGAKICWQNCPQGGVAVTVLFPARSQSVRKAA